ncbi:MAG TPA: DUF6263 family protein [Flavisolibacter sp.]
MKRVLFALCLFTSASGIAQQKINFQKGQKLEVVTTTSSTGTSQMMGQSFEQKANVTVVQSFDVEDVRNGSAVIEHKMKHMKFNMESQMGQNISFDSDKADDLKSEFGQGLSKGLKNKYTVTVDGTGKITEIKEGEGNVALAEDDMATMILSQMNVNGGAPKVGDMLLFSVLPAATVKKGETWTDSSTKEGIKSMATYTVSNITDSEITVDFTATSTMETTQNMMGADAIIKGATKSSGQMIVDKKSGLLKQRSQTVDSEQQVEVSGMTIPSTSKATVTTIVKGL